MNCDEVPGWVNLLSEALIPSNDPQNPMEVDANQVVPDPYGISPIGDHAQMIMGLRSGSSSSLEDVHTKERTSSISSWKSCSSLTSGYMSDETQTRSPMYLMEDDPPLSPDRTLIDLDVSSPDVLETLGPTG